VNVTVPPDNEYVPTFGTSRVVATQFGAFVPGAHKRVDDAVSVTPFGAESLVKRFTIWLAPTKPVVVFKVATDNAGGVTVGVIVELAY
jgi:hypothetical protein